MKVYKILLYLAFVVSVAAISEEAFVKIKEQIRSNCLPKFPDLTEELLEKVNSGYEPENPPNYLKVVKACATTVILQDLITVLCKMCIGLWRSSYKERWNQ